MKDTITFTFVLLVAYQVKHFLADYPLQNKYMLGKFKDDWSFFLPLLAHSAVHFAGTFLVVGQFVGVSSALLLGLFDGTIHFLMDRIKASKKYLGRFKPLTAETAPSATPFQWHSNNWFWYSLGLDQMIHHLTHYAIIYWVITHST